MSEKIKTIKINATTLKSEYAPEIFAVDEVSFEHFKDHEDITKKMKNKNPYTITVIIDNLDWKLSNNKKYVEKRKEEIPPLYDELLYKYFFDEFGQWDGNELYAKWLKKYRGIWKKEKMKNELDYYIVKGELEPRYREKILKKYKNHEKLFRSRTETHRKRHYNLSKPLDHIDWRNPYDNIFVWEENGMKVFRRGGSGSSSGRQINSKFIFGFSLINKIKPMKSYLFLYGDNNQLYFIEEFSTLTIPRSDIGSNYFLKHKEELKILEKVHLLDWKGFVKAEEIHVTMKK